jgi:hypothetical protein
MGAFTEYRSVTGSVQYTDDPLSAGDTVQPATGGITVKNVQFGPFCQTTLTLNNVPQAVVNGTEYQGTKIYDLPAGRINVLGCTATLQQKTTSTIASTLNASVTGAISLGTATASNVSLTGTMVDLLPSTAFTSSATINVAGTAVTAALAASAQFDGTATAKDVYLNTAYATTTDVDANATQTISGTVTLTWVNLGDY